MVSCLNTRTILKTAQSGIISCSKWCEECLMSHFFLQTYTGTTTILVTQTCPSLSHKLSVVMTTVGAPPPKINVQVSWRRSAGILLGKSSPQQRFRLGSVWAFAVKCIQISWHAPTTASKWILYNKNSKLNSWISGSPYPFGLDVLS